MPCGFFILKKGSVKFGLKRRLDLEEAAQTNEDINSNFLIVELDIQSVSVEEEDIYTCIPVINFTSELIPHDDDVTPLVQNSDDEPFDAGSVKINSNNILFKAFSPNYIQNNPLFESKLNEINPNHLTSFSQSDGFFNAYYTLNECIYNEALQNASVNIDLEGNISFNSNSIVGGAAERFRNAGVLKLNGRPLVDLSESYTLSDGEVNSWKGGSDTLGAQANNEIKILYKYNSDQISDAEISMQTLSESSVSGYERLHFIYGIVYGCDFFARSYVSLSTDGETSSFIDYPLVLGYSSLSGPLSGYGFNENNFNLLDESSPTSASDILAFLSEKEFPEIELKRDPVLTFFPGVSESRYASFKTNANHDFGIIYYDERGRSGFVNKLGKVFVEGYLFLNLKKNLQTV